MRSKTLVTFAFALCAGTFIGFIELHSDEVSPTLAAVGLFAALLGFAHPRGFWRWALIAGVSVPMCYVIGPAVGIAPRTWPQPPGLLTYIGIGTFTTIWALAAAALGMLLAREDQQRDEPA
ncbi:MAG: hypothetical protein JO043_00430 [Candidatus Eremiobacteraeota bacterium]|nr:hypothetical protein [Candidatus Eremiobacteraeota bacterium]